MKKKTSNNPNGRTPLPEHKKAVLVGIYISEEVIMLNGGRDAVRNKFKNSLKK